MVRREQKSHDEGGRRRQQWWLVDDNGHEHLAVVGEERDPRDGHYNYYAEKPFSLIRPLACQNRTKVHEYLETVCTQLLDISLISNPAVLQHAQAERAAATQYKACQFEWAESSQARSAVSRSSMME